MTVTRLVKVNPVVFLLALARSAAAGELELTAFQLASSEDLPPGASGASLTAPGFAPSGPAWTSAAVPCTVFACLMQANVIAGNIFVGDNIAQVNATRFDAPWVYWSNFSLPAVGPGSDFASLRLHGINYRAQVWLNGALVGDNATVRGAYAYFELDVTAAANFGGSNSLAIIVSRQYDESLGPGADNTVDLGMTFVDWSYSDPPDQNLGIWRKIFISTHGSITLRSPAVLTALPPPSPAAAAAAAAAPPLAFAFADLSVVVDARNFGAAAASGSLAGSMRAAPSAGGAELCAFSVPVSLAAGAEATVTITSADAACLKVPNPSLWWPWQMGPPTLHTLNLTLAVAGALSDTLATPFGIRTATSALDANKNRLFSFNTLPILVRGGGWSPDLFQRVDDVRLSQQLALTRDLGLNAIRFEGKMEPDSVFESLDSLGILALPGWCCCDAWQHWTKWTSEQSDVAAASMRSQARRLRRFASLLGFLISSDELPPQDVEQLYLTELANASWPLFAASVSAASAATSKITGPTGVKMSGPYSWVPPNYWLEDVGQHNLGGGWGFLTEGECQ